MSATSRARRSDSLYHETDSGVTRRWLCDKVALLEDELHEAQEELYGLHCMIAKDETLNAKLKADVERMFQANVEKNNEVLKLLEDNAKLRELAKIAYAYLAWADGATFSDGRPAVHACDRCEVEDRMRELGIEVGK